MTKKKKSNVSQAKSGSIITLVKEYNELLKNCLTTGREKPLPQSFIDRYKYRRKAAREELEAQLNMSTLLTLYGREQQQKTQKILEKGGFLKKSRQKFFDNLKKSNGN